jgi:hypothetical protein
MPYANPGLYESLVCINIGISLFTNISVALIWETPTKINAGRGENEADVN